METIDVIINSCARPDIMNVSLMTFKERIKSKHEFRYVILEDKVENELRQAYGREWINNNEFDEIHFAEKKMGPGFFFGPAMALGQSDYIFHLEDDNEFIVDINIDPILDIMRNDDYIVEIMLSRGKIRPSNNLGKETINGLELTKFDLFSVATGLFNTKRVKQLIDKIGWGKQLHEAGTLTPMSNELGLKKYVLGYNEQHYVHVGAKKGYKKGAWKK